MDPSIPRASIPAGTLSVPLPCIVSKRSFMRSRKDVREEELVCDMSAILVVGSSGSGKKTLVQALIGLLQPRNTEQQTPQLDSSAPPGSCPDRAEGFHSEASSPASMVTPERQVLVEQADAIFEVYHASIATKYYNAQVSFWRQAQPWVPVLALRSAQQLDNLEGIIVMFDLRKESSFEEATQWAAFLDDDDKDKCAFRVCVGSKLDLLPGEADEIEGGETAAAANGAGFGEEPGVSTEAAAAGIGGGREGGDTVSTVEDLQERRRRCLEWCLDHGFEYVEADCRDSDRGGRLREKEGVPRVVEALQSNVWKGMEFCTDSRPSLMAAAAEASATTIVGRLRSGGGNSGGGGNVHRIGCSSGSSGGDDGTAVLSTSVEDGQLEVSEYLNGFVDKDEDGYGEYGYGALDSGEEDNEEEEDEEEAEEREEALGGGQEERREQRGKGSSDVEGTGGSAGSALTTAVAAAEDVRRAEGGREWRRGCAFGMGKGGRSAAGGAGLVRGGSGTGGQGEDGSGVDLAHIELQARWERQDPSNTSSSVTSLDTATPVAGATPVGHDTAPEKSLEPTRDINPDATEFGLSESVRDTTSTSGGGEGGNAGMVAEPVDSAAVSEVRSGEGAATSGGEEGVLEGRGASSKSGEYLLEAAGSMFGGLGGDFEGHEMEHLMREVRKARELGGNVPDAERRARAADVAMRLAALIGDLGDDSGDDDDDDDE